APSAAAGGAGSGGATAAMTNSSKSDVIAGNAAAAAQLGSMLSPTSSLALAALQGQKWQQVFDLDKVIKQLRATEKTQLRGGGGGARTVLQVQRLNAADMGYYDMVPKQATRDIVVCNACNGSYTKAGFNNHIALQHPSIWDAVPNKLNTTTTTGTESTQRSSQAASLAEHNNQDAGRESAELLGSPTDTLSATMSSCSNGSSSSLAANNSTTLSSSSTSSRHKSSSSKSSSSSNKTSSSSTSRSRSKSSKNRHHSELHHKVAAASAAGGSASSKKIASAIAATVAAAAAPPVAVKDDTSSSIAAAVPAAAAITVFSSSSNSSCSLPTTPAGVAVASNVSEHANTNSNYSPAPSLLEETQPSKKKLKAAAEAAATHHRSKPAKEKQLAPLYDQQQQHLSELDQAVCSITAQVEAQQQPRQHQVDLSAVAEEPLPMHNTSDDNSISLTLDDMLDSKFINEILNTVESDIPFDESALDTSQSQSQPQSQQQQQQQEPATKRLRYDDGTINADPNEYATALYHQQQQQQVYGEDSQHEQEPQLTAINAMQLQQLIYQQQQMLEADQQQQQQEQQLKQELNDEAVAQFSVYDVPSLTDDAEVTAEGEAATTTTTDEHMMLPSIIYEITDNNQVSVLDQQSQQQVIAEFLTQAGYDNVDVNVLTTTGAGTGAAAATATDANHFNDELSDFDFTKLETVSAAEAINNHTKTVKLEAQPQPQQPATNNNATYNSYESESIAQPHRQLVNAKYHEDAATYFNMTLYAGPPRPLAMNTFGLVKLPNGMGATLRKNLLMTRKANHGLVSLNGTNGNGIVGTLARPPPPPPPSSSTSSSLAGHCNGSSSSNASAAQQQLLLPRNPAQGKTIYAQKCSIIAQERLRCNKRTLLSRLSSSSSSNSLTVKRLNELLAGKLKQEKSEHNDSSDQQQQLEQLQQQEQHKRMHSFYEKRRKLMASRPQRHSPVGSSNNANHGRQLMRQRPLHLPLQLQSGVAVNPMGNASPQHQLLKKQLMRTLSDSSNICSGGAGAATIGATAGNGSSVNSIGNNNPWKSNSSTPGSSSASSDLMRVFV
ncbi:hypothetical protein KR044_001432, partial [Drosophila immigrans]